jgi:hypothetical protein
MTVYELATFLIPVLATVAAVISISEDVAVTSAASLRECRSSCHANDHPAQSKFE